MHLDKIYKRPNELKGNSGHVVIMVCEMIEDTALKLVQVPSVTDLHVKDQLRVDDKCSITFIAPEVGL